jgi:alpha-galactosidase
MSKRIVLIGAGSAQFGLGTLTDLFGSEVLRGSTIVLHDINPQALARVHKLGLGYLEQHKLPYTLVATTSRPEALAGADYCVSSIEVGDRFALWEQDWSIPLQYGIRQVYGENGGPGGLFHSLRIIPPILEICDDIMRICPEAYVFNFSNPMSRICTTVGRKHPDLRLIGLCHEIASLERHLPYILDVPFDALEVVAGGLNHFSFLLEARYQATGQDAYPDIRAKAPAYFEGKPERGLFRTLFERFGCLPITTDSHTGEYVQWAWDVVDHKGILSFYAWYKQYCASKVFNIGEPSHERVAPMIEAIASGHPIEELAVNVMNAGYLAELPSDIVVEVPARLDAKGVHPHKLPTLPKGIAGLLRNQVAVHDLTAEAILTQSKATALQALLLDPVVSSVRAAEQTLETILERQQQYLGYLR